MVELYKKVNDILNKIDFNSLFNGFKKYDFALYNSKSVCLNGIVFDYTDKFIGNTSIIYEDRYVAIWNIEEEMDLDILAYCLGNTARILGY